MINWNLGKSAGPVFTDKILYIAPKKKCLQNKKLCTSGPQKYLSTLQCSVSISLYNSDQFFCLSDKLCVRMCVCVCVSVCEFTKFRQYMSFLVLIKSTADHIDVNVSEVKVFRKSPFQNIKLGNACEHAKLEKP